MIAYLTHDEVNAAAARRMARRLGLYVAVLPVKDADLAAVADRIVLDLDNLPTDSSAALLRRAADGFLRGGVAVHSYRLESAKVRTLRADGVHVARRLTATLFAAAEPAGKNPLSGSGGTPHPL